MQMEWFYVVALVTPVVVWFAYFLEGAPGEIRRRFSQVGMVQEGIDLVAREEEHEMIILPPHKLWES